MVSNTAAMSAEPYPMVGATIGVLSPQVVDLPPGDPDCAIEGIETYALSVPLRQQISQGVLGPDHWQIPVVEIRTSDGRVGTGISGVLGAAELLCDVIGHYYAPALTGSDSADILGTWKRLYWLPTHWFGRAGVVHMALGMIDIALWDLAAQRADVPLWRLLGGSGGAVQTYTTDGGRLGRDDQTLLRELGGLVDRGWRRLKIKIGSPDWRADLYRLQTVRKSFGHTVTLMCDANQGWDLATASRMLPALEEAGMDWVEEPLHADDVEGHRRLQDAARLDIAAGESLYSARAFAGFTTVGAIRVVQPDVTRVGGVTEWLQVANLATAQGLRVVPPAGDMLQVHQHLVGCTLSDVEPLAEFVPWTQSVFDQPCVVQDGYLERSSTPGASTAIRRQARRDWQVPGVGGDTE